MARVNGMQIEMQPIERAKGATLQQDKEARQRRLAKLYGNKVGARSAAVPSTTAGKNKRAQPNAEMRFLAGQVSQHRPRSPTRVLAKTKPVKARPKFDLTASLAKETSWKLKKGPLKPIGNLGI